MVTISKEDFLVMFEALDSIVDEYAGAKEIKERFIPVCDKYAELYKEINKEKNNPNTFIY